MLHSTFTQFILLFGNFCLCCQRLPFQCVGANEEVWVKFILQKMYKAFIKKKEKSMQKALKL